VDASLPWYLLYTSGTTGPPKGVIQTYGMAVVNYLNSTAALDLTRDDVTLNPLPTFHTGGINLFVLPTLFAGGTAIVQHEFDPGLALRLLATRATVFFGRMVPIFRSVISVPAGVERMPLPVFTLYTAFGSLLWNTLFVLAGYLLGENWTLVQRYVEPISNLVIIGCAAAVAAFVAMRIRRIRRERHARRARVRVGSGPREPR